MTTTLQRNLTCTLSANKDFSSYDDRFAWNHYLMSAACQSEEKPTGRAHWMIPLIYGYVDQASMSLNINVYF